MFPSFSHFSSLLSVAEGQQTPTSFFTGPTGKDKWWRHVTTAWPFVELRGFFSSSVFFCHFRSVFFLRETHVKIVALSRFVLLYFDAYIYRRVSERLLPPLGL